MAELEGGFSTGKEETNRRWWIPPIIATPFICLNYKGSGGGRAAAAAIPKTRANKKEPTPEDLENKLSPRGSCSWGSPLLRASTLLSAPAIHDRPLSVFPHAECSKRPKAAPTPTPALNYGGSGHACCVWPGPEQWQHLEPGETVAELRGCSNPGCHQRGCKAVPEANLQKALLALLMCQEQCDDCCSKTDSGCDVEGSEFCSIHGLESKVLEIRSATANAHRRFQGERFRSHPVGTAVLILLLLMLVLALGVALAVQPAARQCPVTPATPLSVLGCPHGWVGYNGVCYGFSKDSSTREQGQERCSQLNASLAMAKDEEAMDLLFRLRGNGDF